MNVGPEIVTDNLVFGYDTGYGIEQHSSTRHYKGVPATNVITAGLPGYFGSGGETLYKSNYYGLTSDSGVFQRNYVTNPATANTSTFNNNAGLYKNFTTATLSSSTEYVLVSFDFYMITPYVRYSSPGTGLNGYMGILYTDGSTGNHGWNTSLNTPNAGDDWNNNSAYIGKWRKIGLIVDLTDSKTPASISSMYIYNDKTIQGQGIFTNFIITEHTTVPTGKVLYTSGTRLDTQSIIDLKKTTDIDVSDISFDSIGQPTFDGTDDHITINNPDISSDSFTIQMVVKPDSYSNYPILINPISTGIDQYIRIWSNGKIGGVFVAAADTSGDSCSSSTQLSTSEYTHFTITKSPSAIKVYINGNLETTVTPTVSAAAWTGTWDIGQRANNTYNYNGAMPILKVYNTPLTADEVKINFNSIKKRFGI